VLGCHTRFFLHSVFPIALNAPQYQGLALGVVTLPFAYYVVGLYPGYGMGALRRIRARVYATFTVFALLVAWNYAFQDRQWSRGVLLFTLFFALILAPALEASVRKTLTARGICGVPVVILGAGRTGESVVKTLQAQKDLGFVPVGMLDDNREKWGMELHGVKIVGPISAAKAFEGKAKIALIAMPRIRGAHLSAMVESLSFANIIVVPDLFGFRACGSPLTT
jgi:FlaA1/EpsC-like NDP-sugar epimerase